MKNSGRLSRLCHTTYNYKGCSSNPCCFYCLPWRLIYLEKSKERKECQWLALLPYLLLHCPSLVRHWFNIIFHCKNKGSRTRGGELYFYVTGLQNGREKDFLSGEEHLQCVFPFMPQWTKISAVGAAPYYFYPMICSIKNSMGRRREVDLCYKGWVGMHILFWHWINLEKTISSLALVQRFWRVSS